MAKWQVKRKKTDSTVKRLLLSLRNGSSREAACANAKISRPTFYERLKTDEDFLTQVEQAEREWLHEVHNQKKKLIKKWHWWAIEKELESRQREIYGKKQEIDQNVSGEVKLTIEQLRQMTDEELLAYKQKKK